MKRPSLSSILLYGIVLSLPLLPGCEASYRVYDPYHQDWHVFDAHERVVYRRWEGDTRREHREFRGRGEGEQREYWGWRHEHGDDRH